MYKWTVIFFTQLINMEILLSPTKYLYVVIKTENFLQLHLCISNLHVRQETGSGYNHETTLNEKYRHLHHELTGAQNFPELRKTQE